MKKIALPLAVAPLVVLLAAWAQPAPDNSPEPFSRSRWKAEQERVWGARFEGDVRPGGRPRVRSLVDTATAAALPARPAPPANVRVSFDILGSNSDPAQPETQAEPHLAINPEQENNLLASYQEGRFADGGARVLTYAASFDAGRTWQEGILPGLTQAAGGAFERASDPWVAFGPGGRAYYVSLAFNETSQLNGIFVSVSEDGGRNWGSPVTVHATSADFDDKEAIVVDNQANSPFRGRVYVGWDTATANQRQPLLFSYSSDGGASYRSPVTIDDQGANIGIIPMVGPGGVVHAVWTRFIGNDGTLVAARSTDGGDTWSTPVAISDLHTAGLANARTGSILPTAAIDPRRGILYVVWQDSRFSPGVDQIVFSSSKDGGQTWSAPKRVSDGPLDAANFTPAVAVTPDGIVGVSYYSLRNDPSRGFAVDEYFAISRNQGKKFLRSTRVSPASWDMRFAAFAEGFFLGDYQGLAAGKKMFHLLWIATFDPSRIDPPARQPDAVTRAIKAR
jgi:hypothetical protein